MNPEGGDSPQVKRARAAMYSSNRAWGVGYAEGRDFAYGERNKEIEEIIKAWQKSDFAGWEDWHKTKFWKAALKGDKDE